MTALSIISAIAQHPYLLGLAVLITSAIVAAKS